MNMGVNIQGLVSQFQQMAVSRLGITQDMINNPDAIIQKLMNDGRITQNQYNQARQRASQLQNNPMFGIK